jgi:site-specific DNA-methyltransferase (adenine-specific)
MADQNNYNPDILSCLANLSNDEVFTPPALVNKVLDSLPQSLFKDKTVTFLDPVTKSGVFLREIAKRLMVGLEKEIPDKQIRINHIFQNQIFGIAITELTSLLARRSVYCSKKATGKYSVVTNFDKEYGNIIYEKIDHNWVGQNCEFCGASKINFSRDKDLESHAYKFIHTYKPKEIFNMNFDVILGNPPYQLKDGGHGTSATPIYQHFIHQAKKLNPRYLSMIIPSRWFSGGKGLDEFRDEMLNDPRLSTIVDYFDANECFPGVDISGGVCYFLWNRDKNEKDCKIISINKGKTSEMIRPLLEKNSSTFIRFNEAISIVRKIQEKNEESFENITSPRKPFGLSTNIKVKEAEFQNSVKCYSYPKTGHIDKTEIVRNESWVDKYKVYIAKAYGERGSFPYLVLGKPFLGEKNSCCSETYLVIGPFERKNHGENAISYMKTRFFRFLVLLKKNTQNAAKGVYSFVPNQNLEEIWDDEKLNKKYNLNLEEINFINSLIRATEITNE